MLPWEWSEHSVFLWEIRREGTYIKNLQPCQDIFRPVKCILLSLYPWASKKNIYRASRNPPGETDWQGPFGNSSSSGISHLGPTISLHRSSQHPATPHPMYKRGCNCLAYALYPRVPTSDLQWITTGYVFEEAVFQQQHRTAFLGSTAAVFRYTLALTQGNGCWTLTANRAPVT